MTEAYITRRLMVTEGSPITLPRGYERLHSEPVEDDDGNLLLEIWIGVPVVDVDTSDYQSADGKTIYTHTVINEDHDSFAAEIEQGVAQNFRNYEEEDWDDYDA